MKKTKQKFEAGVVRQISGAELAVVSGAGKLDGQGVETTRTRKKELLT